MMKHIALLAVSFGFSFSLASLAKGPKPADPVKAPGASSGAPSTGRVQAVDAEGKPIKGSDGKPIYETPQEALRNQGVENNRIHTNPGTAPKPNGAPAVVRPQVNQTPVLIRPRTGGIKAPESMPPAFVKRQSTERKASADYTNRPFEDLGKDSEALKAGIGQIERDKSVEDKTELANLEIELNDAIRAQIDIAAREELRGKQADPKVLATRVSEAAAAIKRNRAKLIEAAKANGLSENDPAVKNLLKNMIAVYSGIPFHSTKAASGSADEGMASFMKNLGNLDGKRLLGMAKWFEAYGDAYRTARSGHPPMSIAEAHKEAAKGRDRFVAERAKQKSLDPDKLVATLCECNKCKGS